MKNKKGFISIISLVAIVAFTAMLGAGVYYQRNNKKISASLVENINQDVVENKEDPAEEIKSESDPVENVPEEVEQEEPETETVEVENNAVETAEIKTDDQKKIDEELKKAEEARKQVEIAKKKAEEEQAKFQEQARIAEENRIKEQEQQAIALNNATLCNGIYYIQCPNDTKFICPNAGQAYCETQLKNKSTPVSSGALFCNGIEWQKCPAGYNFFCPEQGDAKCVPQPSISTNNQQVNANNNSQSNQAVDQVEKLLKEEVDKQNSWYEEYLRKQAEIDEKLKPIEEEERKIMEEIKGKCMEFSTGKIASDCRELSDRYSSLESEARRISGIYPNINTLPKSPYPDYQSWKIDTNLDGLSGRVWSPNSTTSYRWSCTDPYSCTLYNY